MEESSSSWTRTEHLKWVKMDDLLQNHLFATHAIAAAGSVTLGTAVTYPLDTIQSLIQVSSGSSLQLTASQILNKVRAISGYSGLYSGFSWLACGRICGMGARFGTYEVITAYFKDGRDDNYVYVSEALMAGMAAGAVESLISSPFELIKLRAQVASASRLPARGSVTEKKAITPLISKFLPRYNLDTKALNHSATLLSILNSKHPNLTGALQEHPWMMTGSGRPPPVYEVQRPSDVLSLEGLGGFWRGLRSGVVRDSVFCGIFFSTWQFLHRVMVGWKAAGMDPLPMSDEEIGPISPLAVSLAAGFSGSVAAAASHSFDTAKSRSQCIVQPKYLLMERKLIKWVRPGKRFEKLAGIHPADRGLLFRGIWLRMARSGIASFVTVGSYYLALDYLAAR